MRPTEPFDKRTLYNRKTFPKGGWLLIDTYVPKPRTYTPDFHLTKHDIIVEAKGYFDKGDRIKMQLIKEQHPDLDIRIVFLNARNKIYKGSKTTYGAWAEKNGFKWAEGSIPEEWLKDDDD